MGKHNVDVRKEDILKILNRDKATTMDNIATELSVSIRTIRTDIAYLKTIIPELKTKRGKHNGGIFLKS